MAHKHDPSKYADAETVRTAARNAITRLEQIEQASSPTNAQLIAGVRDMATYEKHLIRIVVAGV